MIHHYAKLLCATLMVLTISLAYRTTPSAQERLNYVLISNSSIAAFRCSVFAAHARYDAEERRLLSYGLEQARLFIIAAQSNHFSSSDMTKVDFIWGIVLRVWNFQQLDTPVDFVAGQVYESVWEKITGELGREGGDMSAYLEPARSRFSSENCSLLAR